MEKDSESEPDFIPSCDGAYEVDKRRKLIHKDKDSDNNRLENKDILETALLRTIGPELSLVPEPSPSNSVNKEKRQSCSLKHFTVDYDKGGAVAKCNVCCSNVSSANDGLRIHMLNQHPQVLQESSGIHFKSSLIPKIIFKNSNIVS